MIGVETIDHVAVPVVDLPRAEALYMDWLGLRLKTRRKNLDGSPRQTYVLAGENIIGLHLPGVRAGTSPTQAPRVAIAVTQKRFDSILNRLKREGYPYHGPSRHEPPSPFLWSAYFLDSDGNWMEICVRENPPQPEYLSHIVVETLDLEKALVFYTQALGMQKPVEWFGEHFLQLAKGQLYGLKPVAKLSERSRRHGRGCHIAFEVSQEDFDEMFRLISKCGGSDQGDPRAKDGLRPEGEKSTYFFDPDKNRLQITATVPASDEMLSDEEKWRRIAENRAKQRRGVSRFDRGKTVKGT
ncbi:MAG: VOC family protein [Candidatus Binatia bacterium]